MYVYKYKRKYPIIIWNVLFAIAILLLSKKNKKNDENSIKKKKIQHITMSW